MESYVNINDADPLIERHAIYWVLSSESYKINRRQNIDGWEAVMLNLDSIVYGKDNNLIVAFRGTDPSSKTDLWNDLQIGTTSSLNTSLTKLKNFVTGAKSSQVGGASCAFDKTGPAVEMINFLKRENPGKMISLTGHSLGGAVARCAGDSSGLLSITFNAAAPPIKQTVTDENSVNYHIVLDIISAWQYPNTIRIDKGFRPPRPSLFGPLGISAWIKIIWNAKKVLLPAHALDVFKKYRPGTIMSAAQENHIIQQWWKSLPVLLRKALFGSTTHYNPVKG